MLQVYGQDVSEEEFILRMWNALGKYKTSEEDIKKVNEGTLKIYECQSLKMYHAMIKLFNVNDLHKIHQSYKRINNSDIVVATSFRCALLK